MAEIDLYLNKGRGGEDMDFKKYFNIWQTAWNYHKKFYGIQAEADWDAVTEEFKTISSQHRGKPEHEFLKNLLLSVLTELERDYKQNRKKAG